MAGWMVNCSGNQNDKLEMVSDKFQHKYRISSARAAWHDYTGGAYFVTICTTDKKHYFGEIVHGEMQLSEIGKYLNEQLQNVTSHYPYCEMPLFVVMPNHVHLVVCIEKDETRADSRDVARNVSTKTNVNETMSNKSPKSGTLSVVIRGIKSSVTKFAYEKNSIFAWQTRFHDHIVRDQNEMNRIAEYIETNVALWDMDEFK
ncbi:MAG: hypothetical protein PHH23_03830 [Paludibacteraceae bacterium]|nr:hypothetical protein [Paludibacteraceae bacterium]